MPVGLIRIFALSVLLALGSSARVLAADRFDVHSIDSLRGATLDQLLAMWNQVIFGWELNIKNGPGPTTYKGNPNDPHWVALRGSYEDALNTLRAAIGEHGRRPPASDYVPSDPVPGAGGGTASGGGGSGGGGSGGRGGSTQQIKTDVPRGGSNTQKIDTTSSKSGLKPWAAIGTSIFLGAGEMAYCARENMTVGECALDLLLKGAIGTVATTVVGGLIVVFAPGAAGAATVAATGIAIASASGEIFITLEQAGANWNLMAQQQANAERIDSRKMDDIVAGFRDQVAAAQIDGSALSGRLAELNDIVVKARAEFDAFRNENTVTRAASAMCASPARQPLALAAKADQQLTAMQTRSAAIVKRVSDAAALVATCSGADNARKAKSEYLGAQKDLQDLERAGDDVRGNVRDALGFFSSVKTGRQAMQSAARRMAALEKALGDADAARSRLLEATAAYSTALEEHKRALRAVLVTSNNLRGAFPPNPPPHIAAGLKQIDNAYTAEMSAVRSDEGLKSIQSNAVDDLSRIDGYLQLARQEYDDLRACGQVTGEIPDVLQKDLTRISTGVSSAYTVADRAVAGGQGIVAKADECLNAAGAAGEGQLSGGCQGTIELTGTTTSADGRASGPAGSPLRVSVTIAPPADQRVTRVVADNPGCSAASCRDMQMLRAGTYVLSLRLQAPAGPAPAGGALGSFRVKVSAFEGDRAVCSGESRLATVLAR